MTLVRWHIPVFAPIALLAALIGIAALFVRAQRHRAREVRPGANHPIEKRDPDAAHR